MPSTGLPGLDEVLQGLRPGDNVVWMVEDLRDYAPVLGPFCDEACRSGNPLVYLRFARHEALLTAESGARIFTIDSGGGFEHFVTRILDLIEETGRGGLFVFDCLSDLAADWFSDRMLGNFFMIVCPYLYKLDSVGYFAMLKHHHSVHATQPIFQTAQVILEVFRKDESFYVRPVRVWKRRSPTMFMLHCWDGDSFAPVTSSSVIAEVLGATPKRWLEFTHRRMGPWARRFQQAQDMVEGMLAGEHIDEAAERQMTDDLIRMMLTRDPRFRELVVRYFELPALVGIMGRMIGTGMVGGKALGMLLARAILTASGPRWKELLESHDSFYIGSDVFYTYLVQNDCWWLRRLDRDFDAYLQRAAEVRQRILRGAFPKYIEEQFTELLSYFGQSPLIVRSSSLLEDSYGNSFSGKYESVFLANQGSPDERLGAFLDAVRAVYASTMSEASLTYRQYRNVLDRDEQMGLLVQRVSGEMHDNLFFPHAAGVGFSFNPFVWREDIDPTAGVLRLVFGLGTRAVERADDDYARLVALNAPLRQPQGASDGEREFSQRRVDLLDLAANQMSTRDFHGVTTCLPPWLRSMFVTSTTPGGADGESLFGDEGRPAFDVLTFQRMLSKTGFVEAMRELCRTIEDAYEYPVDVEFTANFSSEQDFRLNLLQCRPFPVKIEGEAAQVGLPERLPPEKVVLESHGPIIGHSRDMAIDALIYVAPAAYSELSMSDRYSLARLIGRVVHTIGPAGRTPRIMLVGPGRWGTSMPALGLPVTFNEIRRASVMCELALMHEGLVPDVSLGTHFFNDIVELDMLYLAVNPGREGHSLNEEMILGGLNRLEGLLPDTGKWSRVLHVIEADSWGEPGSLVLNVDSLRQHAVCHWRSGVS